ncbi:MAG: SDR family NAD(P)-dependent oxidoreductase [Anaerolineae bacterium]
MVIENSVIIITGASAGIGRATAVLLAQKGAKLVISARRADRLAQLVDELAAYPGRRVALPGDIRQEAFADALIGRAVTEFGKVDVLINNAGLGHRSRIADMDSADIRTVFDTNVMGLLYATRAAVTQMKQQGRGQIVNVSSIVGQRPLPDNGVYCASKTAVNFLSRTLRMELRPYHITVTLVYPGLTATEFAAAKLGQPGSNRFGVKGISAERVGKAIVKAIQHGRTEVYVTWFDWFFTHINRLFPRTIDWIVGRGEELA